MPSYEYKCVENPEHKYVEVRGINDEQKQSTCIIEGCSGKLSRVFSAPPISFKGSGFSTKSPFV
jgi:predicted nucleic acid-binding Zn ribbon protein